MPFLVGDILVSMLSMICRGDVRIKIVEIDRIDEPTKRCAGDAKEGMQVQKRYVKTMANKVGWDSPQADIGTATRDVVAS
jgi:hypothetical protein